MGWMQEFIKKEMVERLEKPLETYGITELTLSKKPFQESVDYVWLTLSATKENGDVVSRSITVSREAVEIDYDMLTRCITEVVAGVCNRLDLRYWHGPTLKHL